MTPEGPRHALEQEPPGIRAIRSAVRHAQRLMDRVPIEWTLAAAVALSVALGGLLAAVATQDRYLDTSAPRWTPCSTLIYCCTWNEGEWACQ